MDRMPSHTLTKEEVLRRFQLSKQKKQQRLQELEANLRADYKKRTGVEVKTFVAW